MQAHAPYSRASSTPPRWARYLGYVNARLHAIMEREVSVVNSEGHGVKHPELYVGRPGLCMDLVGGSEQGG